MIELFEGVVEAQNRFYERFGMKEKYVLGSSQIEKMTNEEVVEFLNWITKGEIEIRRNIEKKRTTYFSVNIQRDVFWVHLGRIEVPEKRKSQRRVHWMELAVKAMVEKGMKERENKLKDSGFDFAERNSLLNYCIENKLFPADKHEEITTLIKENSQ